MQPGAGRSRKWRARLLALGLVLAAALAVPAAAPSLVELVAPALGAAWGLTGLSVEIDRLGGHLATVRRITFASGRWVVEAAGGRIEYRLGELLRGRARLVAFDRLALTVSPAAPDASGSTAAPPLPLDEAARWRDALPFERAEVRELVVAIPAVGFLGSGELRVGADALQLSLAGETPAAAAGFDLHLRAEPSGSMVLNVSERSRSAGGAGTGSAPLLTVTLKPSGTGLDFAGDVQLRGYAWDLAASLLDLPTGNGSLDGQIQARLPRADDGGLKLAALQGEGRIRSLQWTAASGSEALAIDDGRLTLAGIAVSGTLSGTVRLADLAIPFATRVRVPDRTAEPLTVTGAIRRGALEGLSWSAVFDPVASMPRVRLGGDLRVSKPFLKTLLERWHGTWDLDSGALVLAAELRWPESGEAESGSRAGTATELRRTDAPRSPTPSETLSASDLSWPKGSISLGIRDASAHYDDFTVSGLTGTLAVDLDGTTWRLAPTELRAAMLSVGVEIGELEMRLSGSSGVLAFQELRARAFDGRLAVVPFEYDLVGGSAAAVVQLDGIDLARLLALYGERIAGTGVLDGTLPVSFADGSMSIRDGAVMARAPGGVIRLAPELARATRQPGLDFALAALADFTYTRLSADVDYAPSGELTLGVALQGRNPAIEGGRPIHYNLNVTENVPQLLESLTLHRRLVRDIERRVTE